VYLCELSIVFALIFWLADWSSQPSEGQVHRLPDGDDGVVRTEDVGQVEVDRADLRPRAIRTGVALGRQT
jgi:hypothetical protein